MSLLDDEGDDDDMSNSDADGVGVDVDVNGVMGDDGSGGSDSSNSRRGSFYGDHVNNASST